MTVSESFFEALKQRAGMTPALETQQIANGQLRFLMRAAPGSQRRWKEVRQRLLQESATQKEWTIDISFLVFIRDGWEVGGWRIILKSANLEQAMANATVLIKGAPHVRVELEEFPLPGGGAHRKDYDPVTGKGVRDTPSSGGMPAAHLFGRR